MADQAPSGKPRELTKDEKRVLRTGRVIREMMNTPGWKIYFEVLSYHLTAKRNEHEAPAEVSLDGIAQVLRSESAKGAIMGLRFAIELPQGMLTDADNLRVQLGEPPTAGEDE